MATLFQRIDRPVAFRPSLPASIPVDALFDWTPVVENAIQPVSFAIAEGAPLPWFTPDPDSGRVHHTPAEAGRMGGVVLSVTDACGRVGTVTLAMAVEGGGATGLPPLLPAMPAITRYIAPESGDDGSDGLTAGTAWKTLNGYTIKPGDHIAFKGGERFRWPATLPPNGTVSQRITISGNAWGAGRAKLVGATNDCTTRAPSSGNDAGGHPDWDNGELQVVEWPWDDPQVALFDDLGLLLASQYPRPRDSLLYDNTTQKPEYMLDLPDGLSAALEETGQIDDEGLAALVAVDGGRVMLWWNGSPNVYTRLLVTGVAGSVVSLEAEKSWTSYTGKSDTTAICKPFLQHRVADVQQPGDWCMLGLRKALVWTRPGGGTIRRAHGLDADGKPTKAYVPQPREYTDFRGWEIREHNFGYLSSASATFALFFANGWSAAGYRWFDNLVCHIGNGGLGGPPVLNTSAMPGGLVTQNRAYGLPSRVSFIANMPAGGEISWIVGERLGGEVLKIWANVTDCWIHDIIGSNIHGIHANGISLYQTADKVTIERVLMFDALRAFVTQAGSATFRILRDAVLLPTADEGAGNMAIRIDGSQKNTAFENILALWAGRDRAPVVVNKSAENISFTNLHGLPTSGGTIIAKDTSSAGPDRSATWVQANVVPVAADYLDTSGAIVEADHADVTLPGGRRIRIDMRGVGA